MKSLDVLHSSQALPLRDNIFTPDEHVLFNTSSGVRFNYPSGTASLMRVSPPDIYIWRLLYWFLFASDKVGVIV